MMGTLSLCRQEYNHMEPFNNKWLTLTRKELYDVYGTFDNVWDFAYSFKNIKRRPFLLHNDKRYLIAPLSIFEACSIQLEVQFFEGKGGNRIADLGKVYERYLYHIANLSGRYVYGETIADDSIAYNDDKGNKNLEGEDLVILEGETLYLISSKYLAVPLKYRISDKDALKNIEDKLFSAIEQCYKYYCHCGEVYYPFGKGARYNKKRSILLLEKEYAFYFNDLLEEFKKKHANEPKIQEFIDNFGFIYLTHLEEVFLKGHCLNESLVFPTKENGYRVLLHDSHSRINYLREVEEVFLSYAKELSIIDKNTY